MLVGELGSVSPASTFTRVNSTSLLWPQGPISSFSVLLTVVQNFSSTGVTQIICLLCSLVLYEYKLVAISLDMNGCSALFFMTKLYIE